MNGSLISLLEKAKNILDEVKHQLGYGKDYILTVIAKNTVLVCREVDNNDGEEHLVCLRHRVEEPRARVRL